MSFKLYLNFITPFDLHNNSAFRLNRGWNWLKGRNADPSWVCPPTPLPIIKNIICVLVYLESVLDAGGSYQLHLVLDPTGERRH